MQKIHDERVKLIAEQTLDLLGEVQREKEIAASDAQRIDIWFIRRFFPEHLPAYMVLLNVLFWRDCMIEAFSEAVGLQDFWDSHSKQYGWRRQLQQAAEQKAGPSIKVLESLPLLWLLSAGCPDTLFATYDIVRKPGLPEGIYEFGRGLQIGLVVISELPPGRETLLLRLMGSPPVRKQALEEVRQLGPDDPDALALRRFVAGLRHTLSRATSIDKDQREELMTSAWAEFERYEQDLLKKGRDEGRGEGMAQMLLRILQARGLAVNEDVRRRILSCADPAQLDLWAERAVHVTRAEDIFAKA